ncbi:RICIN domain-containing protein [Actinoallomurus sp. NPDC052308]|uniref:RICIN domain-containing protein n=1 Tax=Actinoallomurus sp. NPDC052308 TaxID=3155530 RepID=UPI0034229134
MSIRNGSTWSRVLGVLVATASLSVIAGTAAEAAPYPIPHIKAKSSKKCVSVLGWSKSKGAHIVQWSCYNGRANNQQFQTIYYKTWKGVKEVQIMNMHSRLCLSVNGKSTKNGAYVNQWSCNGADNTLWAIYKADSSSYVLQNMWSGKCLDVAGNSNKNGAWLTQYTCGRYKNEDFTFPVKV